MRKLFLLSVLVAVFVGAAHAEDDDDGGSMWESSWSEPGGSAGLFGGGESRETMQGYPSNNGYYGYMGQYYPGIGYQTYQVPGYPSYPAYPSPGGGDSSEETGVNTNFHSTGQNYPAYPATGGDSSEETDIAANPGTNSLVSHLLAAGDSSAEASEEVEGARVALGGGIAVVGGSNEMGGSSGGILGMGGSAGIGGLGGETGDDLGGILGSSVGAGFGGGASAGLGSISSGIGTVSAGGGLGNVAVGLGEGYGQMGGGAGTGTWNTGVRVGNLGGGNIGVGSGGAAGSVNLGVGEIGAQTGGVAGTGVSIGSVGGGLGTGSIGGGFASGGGKGSVGAGGGVGTINIGGGMESIGGVATGGVNGGLGIAGIAEGIATGGIGAGMGTGGAGGIGGGTGTGVIGGTGGIGGGAGIGGFGGTGGVGGTGSTGGVGGETGIGGFGGTGGTGGIGGMGGVGGTGSTGGVGGTGGIGGGTGAGGIGGTGTGGIGGMGGVKGTGGVGGTGIFGGGTGIGGIGGTGGIGGKGSTGSVGGIGGFGGTGVVGGVGGIGGGTGGGGIGGTGTGGIGGLGTGQTGGGFGTGGIGAGIGAGGVGGGIGTGGMGSGISGGGTWATPGGLTWPTGGGAGGFTWPTGGGVGGLTWSTGGGPGGLTWPTGGGMGGSIPGIGGGMGIGAGGPGGAFGGGVGGGIGGGIASAVGGMFPFLANEDLANAVFPMSEIEPEDLLLYGSLLNGFGPGPGPGPVLPSYTDCFELLDIVAAVDGSDSISSMDFETLKKALMSFVDQLNIHTDDQRFGVVLYSSNISDVINLSSNRNVLRYQISKLGHPRDGTNTAGAITAMNQMFQQYGRQGVPKVGIVITDGISKNPSATVRAASVSKLMGVNMFAVGVGAKTDIAELNAIASVNNQMLTIGQFNQLDNIIRHLVKRVCAVNGGWSAWSETSTTCTATCGGGSHVVTRTRTCTNPFPSHGGRYCSGDARQVVSVACNTHGCPVNGGWSEWIFSVGVCSVSCGGGSQMITKTRTCTNPSPAYNGLYCQGEDRMSYSQICNTKECPVDGGWSVWIETVGQCSAECGGGSQVVTKTRTCTNPLPAYNGRYCVGENRTTFSRECNTHHCPVHGGWTQWVETVGVCSVSCGSGMQVVTKSRTCTNPAPAYNGRYCVGEDKMSYNRECSTHKCPVDGGWSLWLETVGQCTTSCGGGSRLITKTRTCTNPKPAYNGQLCFGDDKMSYSEACNTHACPVHGGWSVWTEAVGDCSLSCGGGTRRITKSRTCTNPAPANGGKYCVGDSKQTQSESCNTHPCPADGNWSPWQETVEPCSVSCGGGSQLVSRLRTCTNPKPAYNEKYCEGYDSDSYTKACNTKKCPVHGGWSEWQDTEDQCSLSCGGGVQLVLRTRSCTHPAPSDDGDDCDGGDRESYSKPCNTQQCSVDGNWSPWTETTGVCSGTCGGGSQIVTKTRSCTNPKPEYGGKYCVGNDKQTYTQSCNAHGCPVDGGWTQWAPAPGPCSASCGGGSQQVTDTRTCTNPAPANSGRGCVGQNRRTRTQPCNTNKPCPVDGQWSPWSEATGDCSKSCGGGVQTIMKSRMCNNPSSRHGGKQCPGDPTQIVSRSCNTQACPVTTTTTERPDYGPCNDCDFVNGIGYNPHPSDCNKYLQCMFDGKTLINMIVKSCPHGLYWDQKKLTCNRVEEVDCPTEACKNPMLTTYPSTTTCSGYWKCEGGVSKGKCCPEGQAYSIAGYCVPSTSCKTPCTGGTTDDKCDKRAVPGDKSKFEQFVKGTGFIKMQCAPGTVYNSSECGCTFGDVAKPPSTCKPEVYLSFIDDFAEKSGTGVFIQNEGVKILESGVAYFDGKSSLRIPRFSNVDLGGTIYIKLRYKGEGTATKKQAVFTNGECGKEGSVNIVRGAGSTYFSAMSTAGARSRISVRSSDNDWNEVLFRLDNGILTGQVGTLSKQAPFTGSIKRVHCGIQIGKGTGYANFRGWIDTVAIYMCNPNA